MQCNYQEQERSPLAAGNTSSSRAPFFAWRATCSMSGHSPSSAYNAPQAHPDIGTNDDSAHLLGNSSEHYGADNREPELHTYSGYPAADEESMSANSPFSRSQFPMDERSPARTHRGSDEHRGYRVPIQPARHSSSSLRNSGVPPQRPPPARPARDERQQQRPERPRASAEEEDDEDEYLSPIEMVGEYSRQVAVLVLPITITVLITVWAVVAFEEQSGNPQGGFSGLLVFDENDSSSTGSKLGGAIVNALIIVGVILLMTIVIVVLYKYRCTKVIWGWLMFTTGMILGVMGWYWIRLSMDKYNFDLDYFSGMMFLYNLAAVGVIAIFWKAPNVVKQGYLVLISAMMAWSLSKLPEWTTWTLLAAVAIYDIFAVLTPRGPLKVLVETAQERGESIPGLIYETAIYFLPSVVSMNAHSESSPRSRAERQHRHDDEAHHHAEHGEGEEDDPSGMQVRRHNVKLGLGDFVFYSVLIGRAALVGATTAIVCYFVVIAGLCLTLLCLAIYRKALPALPFSIALGIVFYFLTTVVIEEYTYTYADNMMLF